MVKNNTEVNSLTRKVSLDSNFLNVVNFVFDDPFVSTKFLVNNDFNAIIALTIVSAVTVLRIILYCWPGVFLCFVYLEPIDVIKNDLIVILFFSAGSPQLTSNSFFGFYD